MDMSTELSKAKSALHKAFKSLGHKNGHAMPQSESNVDPIIYELLVSSELRAAAEKRYKMALNNALDELGLNDIVRKTKPGMSECLIQGKMFIMTLKVNNPSRRLDRDVLYSNIVGAGVPPQEASKVIDQSYRSTTPAKRFEVSAKI